MYLGTSTLTYDDLIKEFDIHFSSGACVFRHFYLKMNIMHR